MSEQDVSQIRVEGYSVGIMGLKTALEEIAESYAQKPDQQVADALLKRLSKKNYIPDKARASYANAFLREFKKYVGKPYEEAAPSGIDIKVLGPGCPKCEQTEKLVKETVAESGIEASVSKIKDITEIAKHGVFMTPAVVVDGDVKCVGKVPSKEDIKGWITK